MPELCHDQFCALCGYAVTDYDPQVRTTKHVYHLECIWEWRRAHGGRGES